MSCVCVMAAEEMLIKISNRKNNVESNIVGSPCQANEERALFDDEQWSKNLRDLKGSYHATKSMVYLKRKFDGVENIL